jgi:chorismate mutase / prephenate dehydratase
MPSTAPTDIAATSTDPPDDLAALRAELDRIDDALHDTLTERAGVVVRLAESGRKGRVALRPGREAAIIRRLLARHTGPLDGLAVVRIWRELFAGTTALQGANAIAVCDTDPACGYTQIAREHFGALTPLRSHRSPAQAIADVSTGAAEAAVLPIPSEDEPLREAWWTILLKGAGRGRDGRARPANGDEPELHVVALLPFWSSPRPEGAPLPQAVVVCAVAPDPSGDDRSLLGLELSPEVSRARLTGALLAAGFRVDSALLHREPGMAAAYALIAVEGFVTDSDSRLDAVRAVDRRPVVIGAYAVPLAAGSA